MRELLNLSFLYTKYHFKKKSFLVYIILLLIFGFLLIPNENADYITFYIGNISIEPNQFWIGNFGSVFSNIIISILLFSLILGENEKEILSNRYCFEDTSKINAFYKNLHKIIGVFLIAIIFLFILNISLILTNYSNRINILTYLQSLIYFSIPYLFFITFFIYFLEFYIISKIVRMLIFFIVFFFMLFNDKLLNIIGLNELYLYIRKITQTDDYFAIGYLKKSERIKLLSFTSYNAPLFIYIKLLIICISILLLRLLSLKKISRIYPIKNEVNISIQYNNWDSNKVSSSLLHNIVPLNLHFITLIKKDLLQLSKAYSQKKIVLLLFFWVLLLIIPIENITKNLLPIVFVLITYFNRDFLSELYSNSIGYFLSLSPFNSLQIYLSQTLIIYFLYIFFSIPYFISSNINVIVLTLVNLLILAISQVFLINTIKKSLLINIIIVILFSTYLTGRPIINILNY